MQLTEQGFKWLLAVFYVSPGEVPAVGVVLSLRSAMTEEDATRPNKGASHDEVLHTLSESPSTAAPQVVTPQRNSHPLLTGGPPTLER